MNNFRPSEDDLHFQCVPYTPKYNSDGLLDYQDFLLTFQNAAGSHVEKLGLGDKFKDENEFYYILCRLKGHFLSKFEKGKKYTLITYPTQASTLQLYRYAYILDENDNVVFYLISLWVLINQKTRRLQNAKAFKEKIKEVLPDIDDVKPYIDEKLYELDFSNIDFSFCKTYKVTGVDIDSNNHMNNTAYMKIVQYETDTNTTPSFEIDFEKECFIDEQINIYKHDKSFIGKKADDSISFLVQFTK